MALVGEQVARRLVHGLLDRRRQELLRGSHRRLCHDGGINDRAFAAPAPTLMPAADIIAGAFHVVALLRNRQRADLPQSAPDGHG
ncbi:hypothetical protein [Acrocarpospora corrugata]|uniref:hypothetical protein n=1 Tax=Acrocarpospora corrugata TaxID=35763 RepID=UPI0012D3156E|nr:hypothetical protein [Acrocarpospora corrugata]